MFLSLQNYTTFSQFTGAMTPKPWLKDSEQCAGIGITDIQHIASWAEMTTERKKQGIDRRLFYGIDIPIYTDKGSEGVYLGSVLLYAQNDKGYRNLVKIATLGNLRDEEFYYHPRLSYDTLLEHSEGLTVIIPQYYCTDKNGDFCWDLKMHMASIFAEEDIYIGIDKGDAASYRETFEQLRCIPLFCAHVPRKEDLHLLKYVDAISDSVKNTFIKRFKHVNNGLGYIPSEEEYRQIYGFVYDSVFQEFYDKHNVEMSLGKLRMPETDFEGAEDAAIQRFLVEGFREKLYPDLSKSVHNLSDLAQERLELSQCYPHTHLRKKEHRRRLETLDVYLDRLMMEYNLIKEKGFFNYFLIMRDIVKFVDSIGEARGSGRGSAAGALFSYLLDITYVDPIRHGLLFARFMNPDRNDIPDIDIDFSSTAKVKILEYLKGKYGERRVVQIGSYGRLKFKGALKKLATAMGKHIPDNDGHLIGYDDYYINNLTDEDGMPATYRGQAEYEYLLDHNTEFKKFADRHSDWLLNVVLPFVDCVSNRTIHASGVVIIPEEDVELFPLTESNKGIISQYGHKACEALGYVKLDILVVDATNVLTDARRLVKQIYGDVVPHIDEISLRDKGAIAIFEHNLREAIFQFHTYTAGEVAKAIGLNSFEDIVAAVALGRKGPIAAMAHEEYGKAKRSGEINYAHPDLEPILAETYGTMIYQEQMMKICEIIGGMTGAQADHVRKACGKKEIEEMEKWEQVFIDGAIAQGYDKLLAEYLWSLIIPFSEYSFNKSHAVCYALMAYEEAYIKFRYPLAFWTAVMLHGSQDQNKQNIYDLRISAEDFGIKFVFPNIHSFAEEFTPRMNGDKMEILWPLRALQGVGPATAQKMCENGRSGFSTIEEMMESKAANLGTLKKLIMAGFFAPVCRPWEATERIYTYRKEVEKKRDGDIPHELLDRDRNTWVKHKLAVYGAQIGSWKDDVDFHQNIVILRPEQIELIPDGTAMTIGGLCESIWTKQSKRGTFYRTLVLTDRREEYRVQMWSDWLDHQILHPREGDIIELTVIKSSYEREGKTYHNFMMNDPEQYMRILWRS